jgi:thiazole biosynthesis enzyme
MGAKKINDVMVTRAIIDGYAKKILSDLELEVAIVGGGPAGLMAAYELGRKGHKVAVFERNLAPGGGMWGGGLGYNLIVVQDAGKVIFDKLGVSTHKYAPGYYTASSIETMGTLIVKAFKAGASIYNLLAFEDVMVSAESRVSGVVLNWRAILVANYHVDPVSISAKYVVEATGHEMSVIQKVVNKTDIKLATPTGQIMGERSMNAEMGEAAVVANTGEIAPGLFVVGMAANAVMGSHRMGPIFGGMLLSGQKAAKEIDKRLKKEG